MRQKQRIDDEIDFIEKVKRHTIIAMFSDDYLMETLVLKGGNAMDVVYKVAERASIDIDFSMGLEFTKDQLPTMEARIRAVLSDTFREIGYVVFDTKFVERPRDLPKHLETCWGGYRINFKVIEADLYDKNPDNLEFLRRNARIVGEDRKKVFQIDISKFEYCEEKAERESTDLRSLYIPHGCSYLKRSEQFASKCQCIEKSYAVQHSPREHAIFLTYTFC